MPASSSHAAHALRLRHRLGGYREFLPPGALGAAVESVWTHLTPPDAGPDAAHRVLPDPALSLAFACRRGAGGRPIDPCMLLIGPKTRPFLFQPTAGYQLVAVRLKLEWMAPLFDLVPAEHLDSQPDLASVHPRLVASVLPRLEVTCSPDHALAVLVDALRRWAGAQPRRRPGVEAFALDLLRASEGRMPVDAVAAQVGMSPRHLRRSVRRGAGVSLKGYARTLRFLAAVAEADRSVVPQWARIAAEAGFCDQSHLVRESRALCGMAPAAVDRERRAEAEMSNRRRAS
ncbi:MAG TPA: AraC family transcriptional regulator [Gemmatimonadales bacterium]|nr:AraC family transcriptional regulator [Gemmatimonadales bacterium]